MSSAEALTGAPPDVHRIAHARVLGALVVFSILGVLTPLQLHLGQPQGIAGLEFALCLAILEACALRIALLAMQPPRFLSLTFYFYIYIWIGWAGSLQTYLWAFPWPVMHTPDDLLAALAQIGLAMIAYECGAWLAGRRQARAAPPAPHAGMSLNRLTLVWLFSFVGFAYGVMFFGLDGVLGTRWNYLRGVAADSSATDVVVARSLLRAPCLVAFLASVHLMLHRWSTLRREERRLLLLIAASSTLLAFIANYPPAVARSWLGVVLLAPVMLLAPWNRRWSLIWVLVLAFGLTWIYPRADLFRYSNSLDEALQRLERNEAVREHVLSADYSELQMTANGYLYARNEGLMWGDNFLAATLFFVPRAIWSGKAQRTDLLIANAIGYKQKNLSASLWTESYIAFGHVGIALVLFGYGWGSRVIEGRYRYFRERGQVEAAGAIALLMPFWGAYQFYFLRGNLITAVGYAAVPLALIVLLYHFRGRRSVAGPAA